MEIAKQVGPRVAAGYSTAEPAPQLEERRGELRHTEPPPSRIRSGGASALPAAAKDVAG
jgi:hypothetical protein